MTIIYKEGKGKTNCDGLSRWPLDNVKSNPAYDTEAFSKTNIHFMEKDRRKKFRFSKWEPRSGTPDTHQCEPAEAKTLIFGISYSEFHNEFFNLDIKTYSKHKWCKILL
ncbi:hypothetical protein O181_008583 [Austropuccinia psidii MF-1]|uniref:Uncharacterized protein n=1 Tax=Austropuccinia psidii MF-1 TaxID=1389203 RepID=A0A9Q3BPP7_9BASI|nr:hypothetical protein [Austropuccinia psidii MF-1]